jgi:hypothetical protein
VTPLVQANGLFNELPGAHTPGPNCWNGALVALNVLKKHRFTHPEEFKYLVDKNCVPTLSSKLGSLGRMSDDQTEVHAFVWINSQTIYAKHSDGRFSNEKYQLMTMKKMLASYEFKKSCTNQNNKDCRNQINFFDCQSPQGVLLEQIERLQGVESLVNELVFSKETKLVNLDNCSSAAFLKRNEVLHQITQKLRQLTNEDILEPEYLQVWKKSIRLQIGDSQSLVRTLRCKKTPDSDKFAYHKAAMDALEVWLSE